MNFLVDNAAVIQQFCWFVAGAMCYRLARSVFTYRELNQYALKINQTCIVMLARLVENLIFVKKLKHDLLKDTVPDKVLSEIKEQDWLELNHWQAGVMNYFTSAYPQEYLATIELDQWMDALKVEDNIVKKS